MGCAARETRGAPHFFEFSGVQLPIAQRTHLLESVNAISLPALKAWTGRNWFVSLSRETGGRTMAEVETDKRETALLDARSDPAVAAILSRFPGAKIIDVRIPDAAVAETVDDPSLPVEPAGEDDDEI